MYPKYDYNKGVAGRQAPAKRIQMSPSLQRSMGTLTKAKGKPRKKPESDSSSSSSEGGAIDEITRGVSRMEAAKSSREEIAREQVRNIEGSWLMI